MRKEIKEKRYITVFAINCIYQKALRNITWLSNAIASQSLTKKSRIKVLERATVVFTRTNTSCDNFHATMRRVIDTFSLFAVVVTNIISILLFELETNNNKLYQCPNKTRHTHFSTCLINVKAFGEFISPKF